MPNSVAKIEPLPIQPEPTQLGWPCSDEQRPGRRRYKIIRKWSRLPRLAGIRQLKWRELLTAQAMTKPIPPEMLVSAQFMRRSFIALIFADGHRKWLPIKQLEMPLNLIRWETVQSEPSGECITVEGINGELIPIDSSTLRCLVDREYAAKKEAELDALQLTRVELLALAEKSQSPPELKPAVDPHKISNLW